MSNEHQRHMGNPQLPRNLTAFAIGERVRVVHAPASYGYNGLAGIVEAIDGAQISVRVDQPPADLHCATFYAEELESEVRS